MTTIDQEILHGIDRQDVETQSKFGKQYYLGAGMPRNYRLAEHCFRMAANGDDAEAQYWLGKMYDERKVSERNENICRQEAHRLYYQAAEKGNACAQLSLGEMYSKGEYVEKDEVRAYTWLALAAAQGSEEAREKLDELENGMSELPGNIAKAQASAVRQWHEMRKNADVA